MYFSTATTLAALLPVRLVRIINWKIKILLRGGEEGGDIIDVLIRFLLTWLCCRSLSSSLLHSVNLCCIYVIFILIACDAVKKCVNTRWGIILDAYISQSKRTIEGKLMCVIQTKPAAWIESSLENNVVSGFFLPISYHGSFTYWYQYKHVKRRKNKDV